MRVEVQKKIIDTCWLDGKVIGRLVDIINDTATDTFAFNFNDATDVQLPICLTKNGLMASEIN